MFFFNKMTILIVIVIFIILLTYSIKNEIRNNSIEFMNIKNIPYKESLDIEPKINNFGRMMSNMRRLPCVYRKLKKIRQVLGYDPISKYLGRDSLLIEINRRKKIRDAKLKRIK